MTIRLYDYKCQACGHEFEKYVEVTLENRYEEAYGPVICPECRERSDGRKAKMIKTGAEVRFKQGRTKGLNNSLGR